MKKAVLVTALALLVGTTGCYTSRRVAGEELRGGVLNPYLWVTLPIDTLLSPYQIPKWYFDENDPWTPWDVDVERERYYVDRPFYEATRQN
jgi:hypothetical protein